MLGRVGQMSGQKTTSERFWSYAKPISYHYWGEVAGVSEYHFPMYLKDLISIQPSK